MKFRLGLILVGSLTIGAVGCASSGGGTAVTAPDVQGETIAQGERPRQNEMTRAAGDALEEARDMVEDAEESGGDVAAARAQAEGLFRSALESAQLAIAADSTNPLPWYQAGMAQIGLENYVEADRMLDRSQELRPVYMIEIDPLRERTWIRLFNQAQPHLNSGDYEEAGRILAQADAIYERRPEVKIVLGQIQAALGQPDEAVVLFREAQSIIDSEIIEEVDSATASAWREHAETLPLAIADALIASEDYEEAAVQLRMLVEQDPDNIVLARNLASVYIRMEQHDSAAVIYEDLLTRADLAGGDYYQIGVGLYNMEDYAAAADAFQQAATGGSMNRDAAEMWARSVQLQASDLPEGEDPPAPMLEEQQRAAEMWLELDPYNRNAHLIAAQAANRLGDEDRARELVQTIESLPITVDNLQLQSGGQGGGTVLGEITNMTEDPGTEVSVEVTFYGQGGQTLGTESTTVRLPAQEATQTFQVSLQSDQEVTGYAYSVSGLGS